jgi:hypothetical protein
MSEPFRPSLRKDGTFDPDCLEQAGQRWVTAWLKERLSGHDPCFPIDKRGDEDPESLIVAILQDAGTVHPATNLIGGGILDLLDEARKRAPQVPPYLESALQICERVRLPRTSTWFTEELRRLAMDPQAVVESWGPDLTEEILYGAILQSPGFPRAASHESWRAILTMPRYATMAWMGLASSFDTSLGYMEDWWQVCPAPERQAEINQFVFTNLKTEGRQQVRELLRRHSRSWPDALKAAVDSALKKNGINEGLRAKRRIYESAIADAAIAA